MVTEALLRARQMLPEPRTCLDAPQGLSTEAAIAWAHGYNLARDKALIALTPTPVSVKTAREAGAHAVTWRG